MEFRDLLSTNILSSWSSPKWLACIVVEETSRATKRQNLVGMGLTPMISNLVDGKSLAETMLWDLLPFLQTLRRQCQALVNAFIEHGKLASSKVMAIPVAVQGEADAGPDSFCFSFAVQFVREEFEKLNSQLSATNRNKASKLLGDTRDSLSKSVEDFRRRKEVCDRRITSAAASAILWLGELGAKLNPIIQAIMSAVKV
jgi:TATA-binding protein-associated factor